jgi:LytS/YehU family sensor histidine kinase
MKSFFFIFKIAFAWWLTFGLFLIVMGNMIGKERLYVFIPFMFLAMIVVIVRAYTHTRRVRLIADQVDAVKLANRHRRQIEIPFPPSEAFDIVDAAIRELPYVDAVESTRDSLQVKAKVKRQKNLVQATVAPGESTGNVTLICEPEGSAWHDWYLVDEGTNYENIEAISRAISRRISERRKGEVALVRETATERELAVAKLNLLYAQVEPHFLYNTLASAQVLTRTDPPKADRMLGNLIAYLRTSMPRTEDTPSTLGEELERAQAYLEILKIRMGDRVTAQIQVPDALRNTPVPRMMLQTLVENAIKHGLEPVPGGGTLWIIARRSNGEVSITVADDGRGFSEDGGGTGIGLKNVRDRLRLVYGDAASFTIAANLPRGVAATITVPAKSPSPLGEGRL